MAKQVHPTGSFELEAPGIPSEGTEGDRQLPKRRGKMNKTKKMGPLRSCFDQLIRGFLKSDREAGRKTKRAHRCKKTGLLWFRGGKKKTEEGRKIEVIALNERGQGGPRGLGRVFGQNGEKIVTPLKDVCLAKKPPKNFETFRAGLQGALRRVHSERKERKL